MSAKLRLHLDADAPNKLVIAITRTDVAPGEPADLQKFHDLKPGESIALPVYERSLITIADQSGGPESP